MEAADKLAMLLERRGFKIQKEFARRIGVSQQTLNNWLTGKRMPELEYLIRLSRELDVTVDFLVDESQEDFPRDLLSEDDRVVLRIARAIGHDEAIARLALSRLNPPPVHVPHVGQADPFDAKLRAFAEKSRVYFIQDRETNLIKIGFTAHLRSRFEQIRAEYPEIRLVAVIRGGRDVEREIHHLFKPMRVKGEWFLPSPLVFEYAAANACRN